MIKRYLLLAIALLILTKLGAEHDVPAMTAALKYCIPFEGSILEDLLREEQCMLTCGPANYVGSHQGFSCAPGESNLTDLLTYELVCECSP